MGFIFLLILISVAITLANKALLFSSDVRKIDSRKSVLILGDSHTKYALNDSIFSKAVNLSQDADSYFYSYYKLKYFTKTNPGIDTLILSFSRHNIHQSIEKRWLLSTSHFDSRVDIYLPMLEMRDLLFLGSKMPSETITGLFSQFKLPFLLLKQGKAIFGGFESLESDNLKEELEALDQNEIGDEFKSLDTSNLELKYLERIIEYCELNNIQLILLGTPIHSSLHKYCQELTDFKNEHYPEIEFLDYRTIELQDDCFGDLVHLSPKGSLNFSKELQTHFNN